MSSDFIAWIENELQIRNWRQADLAKRAHLDSAAVSMLISGRRKPGEVTCKAIANALGYPTEYVMRQAGLLPPIPDENPDHVRAAYQLQNLPEPVRALIYKLIEAQYTQWENENSRTPEPPTQPRKTGTGPLADPRKS